MLVEDQLQGLRPAVHLFQLVHSKPPPLSVRMCVPMPSRSEKFVITVACWRQKVRLIKSVISNVPSLTAIAWNWAAS